MVDGEVVASMKRTCSSGEFRANLHRGGRAEPVAITEEERTTALRSAEVLGLNVAGVDMLRSSRGPVVVEVNSSPGIEGMEKATGADLAGAMLDFLESRAGCGETRTSGSGVMTGPFAIFRELGLGFRDVAASCLPDTGACGLPNLELSTGGPDPLPASRERERPEPP